MEVSDKKCLRKFLKCFKDFYKSSFMLCFHCVVTMFLKSFSFEKNNTAFCLSCHSNAKLDFIITIVFENRPRIKVFGKYVERCMVGKNKFLLSRHKKSYSGEYSGCYYVIYCSCP